MIDISKIMVTSSKNLILVFLSGSKLSLERCNILNIPKPKLFSIFISDHDCFYENDEAKNQKLISIWKIWEGSRKALTYFVLKCNYRMTKQFLALKQKGDERLMRTKHFCTSIVLEEEKELSCSQITCLVFAGD